MNKGFLKECLLQLKRYNFCYVYSKEQVEVVLANCDKEVKVVPNECGFTINVVRKGVKKNEQN